MMSEHKLRLQREDFTLHANKTFSSLYEDSNFSDVTLVCEGNQQIQAHKVILSSGSQFFRNILQGSPHPHPMVYLRVNPVHVASLVQFLYQGQCQVEQEDIDTFLDLARELKIEGLTSEMEEQTAYHKTAEVLKEDLVSEDKRDMKNLYENVEEDDHPKPVTSPLLDDPFPPCAQVSESKDLNPNPFVEEVFQYFHDEGKEVCLVVRDRATTKMMVRSNINFKEVGEFLTKEAWGQMEFEDGVFRGNKANFPLIPGKITDIFADIKRLNRFGTRVMKFWRKELGLSLGVGEFPAWDKVVVDRASFTYTSHILENMEGLTMRMGDIVDWSSYRLSGGVTNLSATRIKPASGVRKVVDVTRLFIEWSFLVLNVKTEEHKEPDYAREDDLLETPPRKKKNVLKSGAPNV